METLLRIMALIRKELLVILKDPRSRVTLVVPPILQCLVFGYAASFDLNRVPYVLVDKDRSAASQSFTAALEGAGLFLRIATADQIERATPFLLDSSAALLVVIAPDFEKLLNAGRPATIQVIADGRNSNTAGVAQGYVTTIAAAFNEAWRDSHDLPESPIKINTRAWYNPTLETRWNMVPSLIATITMLMTMMLTAMSVAREREEGTFDQLLVAPFRPTEIMIGKAIPSMIVGVTQSTLILLVALFWFRIPFAGSLSTLYIGLLLFLAAAIGIGLFLSSLATSMQQAMIFSFVLLMPFMLLSGLMAPVENMPTALQYMTVINPLRYAISITRQVYLEGANLAQVLTEVVALISIAAVTLPFAAWLFRNRLV